jgi:hypothetical protein
MSKARVESSSLPFLVGLAVPDQDAQPVRCLSQVGRVPGHQGVAPVRTCRTRRGERLDPALTRSGVVLADARYARMTLPGCKAMTGITRGR